MNKLILAAVAVFSFNLMAIEFITEADVQKTLRADKVIEISKYNVWEQLKKGGCESLAQSRSARAYVVKENNQAYLYVTPSGLRGLQECGEL